MYLYSDYTGTPSLLTETSTIKLVRKQAIPHDSRPIGRSQGGRQAETITVQDPKAKLLRKSAGLPACLADVLTHLHFTRNGVPDALLVGFEQLFDSLRLERLFQKMQQAGIPQSVIGLWKELFRTHSVKIYI